MQSRQALRGQTRDVIDNLQALTGQTRNVLDTLQDLTGHKSRRLQGGFKKTNNRL